MNTEETPIGRHINSDGASEVRYCENCNEGFRYNDVKDRYPISCQELLRASWENPEIDFYCSYCYFLQLIKYGKKNKKKEI